MAASPNKFYNNLSKQDEKADFTFSQTELERIQAAVREKEFVRLLAEYARELSDPESRRRYEEDFVALEKERGYAVTFLKPRPGYVVKTQALSGGSGKVFINVCSDENVGRPVSETAGSAGLMWSLPYSLSPPRRDTDRGGETCMVYDVIFHPDTLYLAGRDQRMKQLVNSTAFDALETSFQVKVDRGQVRFPKMSFKGVSRPTVIRTPLEAQPAEGSIQPKPPSPPSDVIVPNYDIRYRSSVDLQDFVIKTNTADHPDISTRPKELLVDIHLPLLTSAAGLDLDVQERSLLLERTEPPRYKLQLALPYAVDEAIGSAKFDKATHRLNIVLPIKALAAVPKTERLSSNDSGIELNDGDDSYRIGGVVADGASDCDRAESNAALAAEKKVLDHRTTKESEGGELEKSLSATEAIAADSEDNFLDRNVTYTMPAFTAVVEPPMISFTLEAKNVDPASIVKRVCPERGGVAVKFASLGSGLYPLHHAFAFEFLEVDCGLEETDVEIECWDNNVVVQLCERGSMRSYRVGLNPTSLRDKTYTLERTSLALNDHETECKKSSGKRKPKYNQEKHPKIMAAEKLADRDHHGPTDRDGHSFDERERHGSGDRARHSSDDRDRHSSGESLDSMMSMSPYERIQMGEEQSNKTEEEEESEAEEEEDRGNLSRYMRATSCEEGLEARRQKVKGILKKRKNSYEAGVEIHRPRCYSESNLDEYGWNSVGSGLSQTKIMEEDEGREEEGHSFKKSVRFSEKVHQQIFRTNSTILAKTAKNKRKAEKKRKAIERRVSEGDSQAMAATSTLSRLHGNDDESHDDSGLASSFEEAVVLGGGGHCSGVMVGGVGDKAKLKKKTKKRTKQFEMSGDLIFDLDI